MAASCAPADPAPDLARLIAEIGGREDGTSRPPPPVHLWRPAHCGSIDIRIARDGSWTHDGRQIARPALVRLFASVLRLDADGFHLVTPVEKLKIAVEDAPFLAVRLDRVDGRLRLLTNVGDVVWAGPEHPLSLKRGPDGAVAPYVEVRRGLLARLTRPVFYELADMAEARGDVLGVQSDGAWFPLGPAA